MTGICFHPFAYVNGKHNLFKFVVALTIICAKLFENFLKIGKERQETHEYSINSGIYLNRAKEAQGHCILFSTVVETMHNEMECTE